MSKPASTVSAAEISRLADVTRATVSNWRRRHDDFPKPIAGSSEARPQFDLREVQEWLVGHGVEVSESPVTELRTLVRSRTTPDALSRLMAGLRASKGKWSADPRADVHGGVDVHSEADVHSRSGTLRDRVADLLLALERAAAADGNRAALDVLAERALEDTAATGVYITPEAVAKLMAALLDSPAALELRSVLDPACGSGSLVLAATVAGAVELYGQDALSVQVERTRLLLEAEADLEPDVREGDSLTADAFPDLRVDAVLCNPPYGQRDWGSGELAFDTRWDYGTPPRGEPELAWVQHAIAHLRPGGTALLLLPPAVATRPSGRKIRAGLVRKGALRAVIGLAPGAAQPWHVGLQIWVLRPSQAGEPASDTMLFVDTTALPATTDGIDWEAVTESTVRAWRAFDGENSGTATISGFAAAVRLVEVLDDEVDLTPARYVRSSLDSDSVSDQVDDAIRRLSGVAAELASVTDALGGWSAASGKSWRFVSIADLVNYGQLEWVRASPPSTAKSANGTRVLTAPDVATGSPASGSFATSAPETEVEIRDGDVLIPAVRSDRTGGRSARVAGPEDVGAIRGPHVHLLRLDRERLDPWFVAGFLTGAENVSATRTSTIRFDPSRLRIPVLALAEQQRYGETFRHLFLLRNAARRAGYAAEHVAELVTTGLTAGALAPDEKDQK
ncbi:N-6 DNA methylase [Nocardia sp. NBC_01503]|uniref:N-6 DNA methylase n=1 Tax=Nocardia sp. NBC_01503 TaxID=2975997 RepID=UPI002E7BA169|nr:N-6 DNA methylase [Nocardia sp. NBC_01503]WTL32667.1 N-6 DNA methylase [Nocardia sp. NBC_01503]